MKKGFSSTTSSFHFFLFAKKAKGKMYKAKLQELCQQKRWALPRYTSMKDGPDHIPRFKASVFLNGMSFHSSTSCKSCKEAQNDAAKSAFLHFISSSPAATPTPAKVVNIGFYKNLLQELTQREDFNTPEYKTMKCGVPHRPTFFSSVEVEGEVFYGKGEKSKKEAEINAAKVAYTTLTERLQGKCSGFCSPELFADEPLKSMFTSDLVTAVENEEHDEESLQGRSSEFYPRDLVADGPLTSMYSSDLATAVENEEHAEEMPEVKAGDNVFSNATTSSDNLSSCSKSVPVSAKESLLSTTSMHLDISALSISDSNMKKGPGSSSYLLNNRFRVYRCFPDIAFPKGITVLPISEDSWVAVSLEFPNEKDN
ncbi:Ribonuclease 3, putative [Theobroma cacao]|uniref:Ribonuclease 3, putative n=1 Tax=Theobroma cacao TaxID=3641 RepID=A0A061GUY0_THECC|nr:Ribonuclease 3, putative [Theobroma cacao]